MDKYEITLGSGRKTIVQLAPEDLKRWPGATKLEEAKPKLRPKK